MIKLIAIIRGVKSKFITPIIETLLHEGINDIEISLSDEKLGLDCIKIASESFNKDELYLGVGTVINKTQVDRALNAGARYVITPGWDTDLIKYIQSRSIPVIPGVFSPGEVMQAINLEIQLAKLFPANFLGEKYIKALNGPYPEIKFLAVGGVNLQTIPNYLKGGFAGFGLGSCLIPRGSTNKELSVIKNNAKQIRKLIKDFEETTL